MKILLGDFNAKVSRKTFSNILLGMSLHEISNDNAVRVVNFAISKTLTVKTTMFPYVIFINLLGHLLMGRRTTKLTIF
jgi:hypothetical protein